jgi:hypothetical protein
MGPTPLALDQISLHYTYSDDFQELLPLFIRWMGGLFLDWGDGSHPPGRRTTDNAP